MTINKKEPATDAAKANKKRIIEGIHRNVEARLFDYVIHANLEMESIGNENLAIAGHKKLQKLIDLGYNPAEIYDGIPTINEKGK